MATHMVDERPPLHIALGELAYISGMLASISAICEHLEDTAGAGFPLVQAIEACVADAHRSYENADELLSKLKRESEVSHG